MESVKVYVRLKNGEEFFGYIFVEENKRVQDTLNDERMFLPINKHKEAASIKQDVYKLFIINKTEISSVEEV